VLERWLRDGVLAVRAEIVPIAARFEPVILTPALDRLRSLLRG
jgi:hypothetical protein